jgi:hypothetical protein
VFLSGNVVATMPNGRIANVENASVLFASVSGAVRQSNTDAFGDFKIDGLARDTGDYRLSILHDDHGTAEQHGSLLDSEHLGSIELR